MKKKIEKKRGPEYLGPGCWYTLHLTAANAHTKNEKEAVLTIIKLYATKFFCPICEQHFREFLKDNPVDKYIKKENGLFRWSWKCHNNANRLTGKPLYSYERACFNYDVNDRQF